MKIPYFSQLKNYTLASSVAVIALVGASTTLAYAGDVVIDDLKIVDKDTTVTIKRIEVLGSNLEKSEILKLFETGTKKEESVALLAKLQAAKFSIPDIEVSGKNEFKGTFKDFLAVNIDKGKIGKLTLAGFEGGDKAPKGPTSVKVGSTVMESVDLSKILEAARTGKPPETMDFKNQTSKVFVNNISVVVPDEKTPKDAPGGNLSKITVGSLEGSTEPGSGTIQKGLFEVKNFVVEFPKASAEAKNLAELGYDKVNMGLKVRGNVDEPSKKFNLEEMTFSGVDWGAFTVAAKLENFVHTPSGVTQDARVANLMAAKISNIQVSFANSGIFDKAVVLIAKQQGAKPEDMKAQWTAMAVGMLPAILAGDPAGKTIGEAIAKFIANPKNVTIGATSKGEALPISSFTAAKSPADILSKINVTASANQ